MTRTINTITNNAKDTLAKIENVSNANKELNISLDTLATNYLSLLTKNIYSIEGKDRKKAIKEFKASLLTKVINKPIKEMTQNEIKFNGFLSVLNSALNNANDLVCTKLKAMDYNTIVKYSKIPNSKKGNINFKNDIETISSNIITLYTESQKEKNETAFHKKAIKKGYLKK